ncbi:MAG: zinc ribbon domain-containing protein [Clostridia bacterium]|nr:zinc ribbon domain-containing protein [Clostridia bacterium]
MKCPKCDKEIPDGARFCTKCGANIEEAKIEVERKLREAEENKKKIEEEQKLKETEEAKKKVKQEEEIKGVEEKTKSEKTKSAKKDIKAKESKNKNEIKKKKSEPENVDKKNEKINEKSSEVSKEETNQAKEEKSKTKKKKKHIFLKLIIVLIIIALILFTGSYGLYRIDLLPDSVKDIFLPAYELVDEWLGIGEKDKQNDESVNETNSIGNKTAQEEDEIKLVDEDKELVYDYYNKKIAGNEYKIPAINLDYSNIESINKEIANLVEKDLKAIENVATLPEGSISRTDYRWYQNKNVLSVVFFIEGYHVDDYYVYNIDIYTGEEITNKELLDIEKIDEDEFPTMCSEAVEDYYDTYLYSKDIAESAGAVYSEAKRESIDENNFKVSKTDMFIGGDGKVYIVAEVTTIAGAGYNNFIINIENLKKNSKNIFKETTNSTSNSVSNTVTNTTNTTNTTNMVNETNLTR